MENGEIWNQNAELWITAVRGGHIPSRARVTNDAICTAIMRHAPKRIIDVGCGEGWLARRLSAHCAVTGFDASPMLIDAARHSSPGEFHTLSYSGFRANPTFAGIDFDAAVANFSLFEEDIQPLLSAISAVLHSDGHLIIQTLHPSTFDAGWQEERFASLDSLGNWHPMPWYCRGVAEWEALLAASGFCSIQVEEPRAGADSPPSSLLLTARRASSRGTGTPGPPSIPASP